MANPRKIKICCAVTVLIIITLVIIFTTLAFTVLKPKRPIVTANPVGLDKIQWGVTSNVTLNMILILQNPNYASFKFANGTADVAYHGVLVSRVPIPGNTISARGKLNINTSADLMTSEMVNSPYFMDDVVRGSLSMTSTSKLQGKAVVFNFIKRHATIYTTCNISVFIISQNASSHCLSKLKF